MIGGSHDHDGHMKIGLWVLAGILSFLIIEKVFAKEGEFEHVSQKLMYECLIYAFLEDQENILNFSNVTKLEQGFL